MSTPTTTWPLIRANMVAVIETITPDSLSSRAFRRSRREVASFREYAEANDQSIFREFEISTLGPITPVGARDRQVELRSVECEIVVAYPHKWGLYRHTHDDDVSGYAAMRSLADEDVEQIAQNVGVDGYANALAGQFGAQEPVIDIEDGEGVSFATLSLLVQFYQDVTQA